MIKKVWHFIFYFINKFYYRIHILSNRINPFLLLYKIPFVDKYYKSKGVSLIDRYNEAFSYKNFGFSFTYSIFVMHGILFLLFFTFFNSILLLLKIRFELNLAVFVSILIILVFLNSYVFLKTESYNISFQEFNKLNRSKIKRYYIFCFVFILLLFVGFYLSLTYYSNFFNTVK